MPERTCAACGYRLDNEEYSNNQWRKGPGISRRLQCVAGNIPIDHDGFDAVRRNMSTNAVFYDEWTSAGTFRNIYMGR